ncbi:hypothetical protein AA2016_2304 [Aminobacter aminovorans]|uniref:Uncharacterized protein n=1 Tax=Aminobacter aminovorans TaxID=83263 RepID=A0AAC8YMV2_AMIAI|nr:hypothetical protein AA2016_2304 [Aminobacter aminovorans]
MAKLTPSMIAVLENLSAGRDAHDGFPGGRSASGGFSGTIWGLRRRGYIDLRHNITDAGRAALAAWRARG